jgi:hypothetical protein
MTMGRRDAILAAVAAWFVAGCAAGTGTQASWVDTQDVADAAAVQAARCATDLDALAVSSPESARSALDAGLAPARVADRPVTDRDGLARKDRDEVARRLQAVLDTRTAVGRVAAHAGPWSSPQDGGALSEHARSVANELCRVRDVATALARRAPPARPAPGEATLAADRARD